MARHTCQRCRTTFDTYAEAARHWRDYHQDRVLRGLAQAVRGAQTQDGASDGKGGR